MCVQESHLHILPQWMAIIMMDVSLLKWGVQLDTHMTQGEWTLQETMLPINLLELRVVRCHCLQFLPLIRVKHMKVRMDNLSCMFYISWQGEARSPSFCAKNVKLWNWCICNQIITVAYLAGVENVTMDALSILSRPWMGNKPKHITPHIPSMGHPSDRLVLHRVKQDMYPVLLKRRTGSTNPCGMIFTFIGRQLACVHSHHLL